MKNIVNRIVASVNLNTIKVIPVDWATFEARQDGDNRILVGPKFFKHNPQSQRWILIHELGHWFRNKYVSLADIMGFKDGEKFYNLFGTGNSEEGFAEAFVVYIESQSELKSRYPEQYEAMKGYVGSNTSIFKSWADKTITESKNWGA